MQIPLQLTYSSTAQRAVHDQIMSGTARSLMVEGGSGSGKTYGINQAILTRALEYAETEHYLLKTDLKVLKASFDRSVISILEKSGIPQARSRKRNQTYFYDEQKCELHLGNGSTIFLRPIRSPRPYGSRGDSGLLGMNAETVSVDEATTIPYEWYEFLETRVRSAHGCPPLFVLSQNPDARAWTTTYFGKRLDPKLLQPLSDIQIKESKIMRIEAWENSLQDDRYLEILKNSGNATRFYWGAVDDTIDFEQIYQYSTNSFCARLFNIYALDPGYKARTAIIQLGFGGDLTVNIKELCYEQGFGHNDFMREIRKIIDSHAELLSKIRKNLLVGQEGLLTNMHILPHLIVDCARTDLIEDINKNFNYTTQYNRKIFCPQITVIPSRKGELKYLSIERAKKLKQVIDPQSKFYLNEISNYQYKDITTDDERIPDGNDDLLDAALYGMRYILEDVFEVRPDTLTLPIHLQQLYERIKTIEI